MQKITAWSTPPTKPVPPRQGELHLWLVDLDIPPANFEGYLSVDERDRADRMLDATGSRRFVTARGCLKKVLGDYLATDARLICFQYGKVGKPEIGHPGSHLRFNLSHSGHLALIALTRQSEIGVDIEPLKSRSSLLAIARKLFGTEVHGMLSDLKEPQRTARFFQLWTRREAQAKCSGTSVFSQPDSTIPTVNFEPETGCIGAVAVSGGVPEISKWRTFRLSPVDF